MVAIYWRVKRSNQLKAKLMSVSERETRKPLDWYRKAGEDALQDQEEWTTIAVGELMLF